MRPIRVTGVTGTSVVVPLDVYAMNTAQVTLTSAGTPGLQTTTDNVFDPTITPTWVALVGFAKNVPQVIPAGTRAVQGTSMVPADVLSVSQQSTL